jgi:hypothetical protein
MRRQGGRWMRQQDAQAQHAHSQVWYNSTIVAIMQLLYINDNFQIIFFKYDIFLASKWIHHIFSNVASFIVNIANYDE